MLRFRENVFCRLFREQVALVLHHASQWSEITGDVVTVLAIGDMATMDSRSAPADLGVVLSVTALERDDPAPLAAYLVRVLDAHYDIEVDGERLRIAWDARRAALIVGALPQPVAAAAS